MPISHEAPYTVISVGVSKLNSYSDALVMPMVLPGGSRVVHCSALGISV